MTVTTEYTFTNFGFTLPAAVVEVSEVQATAQAQYWDGQNQRNTIVRIKVWASETAKAEGKQPLEQSEKFIDLDETERNTIFTQAINELFPPQV